MINKNISLLLVVVLMLILMVQCGGKGKSSSSDSKTEPDSIYDTIDDTGVDEHVWEVEEVEITEITTDSGDLTEEATDSFDVAEAEEDGWQEDVAPSTCLPLAISLENTTSWTVTFMGSGTHATMNIRVENSNHAGSPCHFSDVKITKASLYNSTDDTLILDYETIEPENLVETLDPGQSLTINGVHCTHSSTTASFCDTDVRIKLEIEYTVVDDSTVNHISVESVSVPHTCVV